MDRRTDGWTDRQKSPNDCSNYPSTYALWRGLINQISKLLNVILKEQLWCHSLFIYNGMYITIYEQSRSQWTSDDLYPTLTVVKCLYQMYTTVSLHVVLGQASNPRSYCSLKGYTRYTIIKITLCTHAQQGDYKAISFVCCLLLSSAHKLPDLKIQVSE